MLVLALDTSSAAVSAAVVETHGDGIISGRAEHVTVDARGHGEYLAPMIAACLTEAELDPGALAAIVVGTGPGPYTGLRVGLVTAAVLSETLGIPAYGVCSLDGIAGFYDVAEQPLLVASDARRKEVYWAVYQHGERITGPEVSRPADVPRGVATAMTGAGAELYREVLGLPLFTRVYPALIPLVRGALDKITSGAHSDPLTPLYLRRPDAVEPGRPKSASSS